MARTHVFVVAVVAFAAVAGCQAEGFERYVSQEDRISFRALDGWGHSRERASLVFSGEAAGFDGTRIVVRAVKVPKAQRGHERRSFERVAEATKQVLSSLPDAKVFGPFPDVHTSYRSARFSLSFQDRETGTRYDRRHVVLIAPDQSQIVHLFVTAPAGKLPETASLFDEVVATASKEG